MSDLAYSEDVEKILPPPGSIILANEPRLLRELLACACDHFLGLGVALQAPALLDTSSNKQIEWIIVTLDASTELDELHRAEDAMASPNILGLTRDGQVAHIQWADGGEERLAGVTLQQLIRILRMHTEAKRIESG